MFPEDKRTSDWQRDQQQLKVLVLHLQVLTLSQAHQLIRFLIQIQGQSWVQIPAGCQVLVPVLIHILMRSEVEVQVQSWVLILNQHLVPQVIWILIRVPAQRRVCLQMEPQVQSEVLESPVSDCG